MINHEEVTKKYVGELMEDKGFLVRSVYANLSWYSSFSSINNTLLLLFQVQMETHFPKRNVCPAFGQLREGQRTLPTICWLSNVFSLKQSLCQRRTFGMAYPDSFITLNAYLWTLHFIMCINKVIQWFERETIYFPPFTSSSIYIYIVLDYLHSFLLVWIWRL